MKRSAYLGCIIWIIFLTKLNTPGITSLFLCMCVGYIFSHIKQSGHFSCGTKCFLIHLFRKTPWTRPIGHRGLFVLCTIQQVRLYWRVIPYYCLSQARKTQQEPQHRHSWPAFMCLWAYVNTLVGLNIGKQPYHLPHQVLPGLHTGCLSFYFSSLDVRQVLALLPNPKVENI